MPPEFTAGESSANCRNWRPFKGSACTFSWLMTVPCVTVPVSNGETSDSTLTVSLVAPTVRGISNSETWAT